MQHQRRSITLEQKLKALKEVEEIYRLKQKWQRLTPGEKAPNWDRMADRVLKHAMGTPVQEERIDLEMRPGRRMHEHEPVTARMIERTLRNGIVHPDVLHSFRDNRKTKARAKMNVPDVHVARADDLDVRHVVQHAGSDLQYPAGHLQGYGFVPGDHGVASHVQLEQSTLPDTVPAASVQSAATAAAYH